MDIHVFDQFPEPVLYIQSGTIQYSNSAVLTLEPDWTAGAPLPAALDMEPDEDGVFSCCLGKQEFQAAATRMENGLLLTLRRPVCFPSDAVLSSLPIQLREITQNIQSVATLLTPLMEEDSSESSRLHLSMLYQSFYRLLRLARHLELARQNAPARLNEQALDLVELCREISYGTSKLAEQAGVTLNENIPGGVILTSGDRELLEIMLLELLSNAIKAAGKGGEIGVTLSFTGKRALIVVWDNGPGMSQADLTATLDGASPESLPRPGTGLRLGLAIARYAAAAHDGAILLESREGQGMHVTVSLPLKRPGKQALHTPRIGAEETFSPLVTLLSDALPWQVFEEQ